MASWEYMHVTDVAMNLDPMLLRLEALGSLGWEVVGFASAERKLGLNPYTVLLKREVASYLPPDDVTAGWKRDPSGRAEQRYWDGLRWVEHVMVAGTQSTDYPNVR